MDSSSSSLGGDDRWKLSKKGRSRSGRPHAMDASTGSGVLSRSYSASVSSSRSTSTSTSTSTAAAATGTGAASSSHQAGQQAEPSSRLSKKCVEAVKEHRARFYIVRRCVSMLVCWRDY